MKRLGLILFTLALAVPAISRAAFPGSTGRIVFWSSRDGGGSNSTGGADLYTMSADGTQQRRLTTIGGGSPAWSPDGSKIAYTRGTDDYTRDGAVWVVNADGTGEKQLTHDLYRDSHPTWSPDGSKIAFSTNGGGIFVINADGTGEVNLTHDNGDIWPAWSPNGNSIAFLSGRDGQSEIYVMNADGSQQSRLTINADAWGPPSWSPDSTKIAFERLIDNQTTNDRIAVMNADGSSMNFVGPADAHAPAWSPDGQRIAFSSTNGNGYPGIYVMNSDGTNVNYLSQNRVYEGSPDWQPTPKPGCPSPIDAPQAVRDVVCSVPTLPVPIGLGQA